MINSTGYSLRHWRFQSRNICFEKHTEKQTVPHMERIGQREAINTLKNAIEDEDTKNRTVH